MANQEQLDILKQGVDVWNEWREEHPEIRPDLSETHLREVYLIRPDLSVTNLNGANLNGANLIGANLNGAKLRTDLEEANLSGAKLRDADLRDANLFHTNLSRTNLIGASLSRANLDRANLDGANLSRADLMGANLDGANLSRANLSRATVGYTLFTDVDLREVKGLETITHYSPSSIGIDTLYRSQGQVPESFLRKAGVPEDFLTYLPSLMNNALEYYICFISYSNQDEDFAHRLYADLQAKGVRCWFAPEHMKIGDKIRQRIDESIRLYDKLLLVLSEQSVKSAWVEFEVEAALAKERRENHTVLFPIRLDSAVMESTTAWAAHIKDTRNIGNFTSWKKHDSYQNGLQRLLHDLKTETSRRL